MALLNYEALPNFIRTKRFTPDKVTGFSYEGKAIVATKQIGFPAGYSKRKKKHGWHSEAKKIEAATLYAALGNFHRVSELAKVPVQTVQRWSTEDWWLIAISKVKKEQAEEMDAKTTKIVDKALDKIMDRIETGDYVYDIRKGVAVQMPMSGRDLAIVAGTVFDKRQLIRGEATKISKAVNSEEFLEKLADKFIEFSKTKLGNKTPVTLEGEVVEEAEVVSEEVRSGS